MSARIRAGPSSAASRDAGPSPTSRIDGDSATALNAR